MKLRIVVSAIIEKNKLFLFGKKAVGVGPYPDKWLILGGGVHIDSETLDEALQREIWEEAHIRMTNIHRVTFDEDIREKNGEMIHFIFLTYKADWLSEKETPGDDIVELQWFTKEEIATLDVADVTTKVLHLLHIV